MSEFEIFLGRYRKSFHCYNLIAAYHTKKILGSSRESLLGEKTQNFNTDSQGA